MSFCFVQAFNWLQGSIGSSIKLVQGLNCFKGSIGSRFNWFKVQLVQGLIGSRINWFMVQLVQLFNLFKMSKFLIGSIGSIGSFSLMGSIEIFFSYLPVKIKLASTTEPELGIDQPQLVLSYFQNELYSLFEF